MVTLNRRNVLAALACSGAIGPAVPVIASAVPASDPVADMVKMHLGYLDAMAEADDAGLLLPLAAEMAWCEANDPNTRRCLIDNPPAIQSAEGVRAALRFMLVDDPSSDYAPLYRQMLAFLDGEA